MDARPSILELAADVLRERLHHRVGHQVAKLGLVPVLLERVDIGDGEEPLRGVGQERFTGPIDWADTSATPANNATQITEHDTQVKKRGTAQLLVSIGAGTA